MTGNTLENLDQLVKNAQRPSDTRVVAVLDLFLELGAWVLDKHKTEHQTQEPQVVILPPAMVELTRRLRISSRVGRSGSGDAAGRSTRGSRRALGTPPKLLVREVYTSGFIPRQEFTRLDEARRLRMEVVHGLGTESIEPQTVSYLIGLARNFLRRATRCRRRVDRCQHNAKGAAARLTLICQSSGGPFSVQVSDWPISPSPLYSGERGWGEGAYSQANPAPLPPTPLPRMQGRGGVMGQTLSSQLLEPIT